MLSKAAEEVVALRREVTREALVPVPGAEETITTLRARGLKIGLITVCSEDGPLLWEETPFYGLFDAEVFSATCGLRKPDPRIYRLSLDGLGVDVTQIACGDPHHASWDEGASMPEAARASGLKLTGAMLGC